jgi:hypothetical protein
MVWSMRGVLRLMSPQYVILKTFIVEDLKAADDLLVKALAGKVN